MKVVKHSVNSPRIFEKVKRYDPILYEELPKFFQTKDYGESVKEISYAEILVPDEIGDNGTPKIVYNQEKQTISCIIQPEYKEVCKININEYGNFIAKCYLDMSIQFSELMIKDFKSEEYIKDLEYFFKENNLV